ncbi:prepilin peptidase [Nocardioides sp.]|uniref:prepilin peptidase n=1 Tax=Nocardioides sp. TaxID=35761 RepID=UPI003513218B
MDLLGAVVGALTAPAFVPLLARVVARLPEPPPPDLSRLSDAQRAVREAEPPKPLYADLAVRPAFVAVSAALASLLGALGCGLAGPGALGVGLGLLAPVLAVLAVVDARTRHLPRSLVLGATLGLVLLLGLDALVTDDAAALLRALVLAAVVRSVFWLMWFLGSGLGFGDVRLIALLGLATGYLGSGFVLLLVLLGPILLVAVTLVGVATRRLTWRTHLPFGPPLILGYGLALAVGALLVPA